MRDVLAFADLQWSLVQQQVRRSSAPARLQARYPRPDAAAAAALLQPMRRSGSTDAQTGGAAKHRTSLGLPPSRVRDHPGLAGRGLAHRSRLSRRNRTECFRRSTVRQCCRRARRRSNLSARALLAWRRGPPWSGSRRPLVSRHWPVVALAHAATGLCVESPPRHFDGTSVGSTLTILVLPIVRLPLALL